MHTLAKMIAVASLALGLTGCGTLLNLGAESCAIYDHPRIYGATRIDLIHVLPEEFPLGFFAALLDLPFSLLFDTLGLPWSIPANIEKGDKDTWPEPDRPNAIVEGVVVEADTPGHQVRPMNEIWRSLPAELKPLQNATVRVMAKHTGPDLEVRGKLTTDAKGHFSLFSEWDTPWKWIRIECDGYQPVEIPVSSLHSPIDKSYWSENRLLIRLAKR